MIKPPYDYTRKQLKRVGVSVVAGEPLALKCDQCSKTWVVKKRGLKMPKNYWKCPDRCNAEEKGELTSCAQG